MSFNNTKTPSKPTAPGKYQVPMRQHPTRSVMEYYLEGELKERFCKLYPKNTNRRIMQWFGISFSTLQRFKRELGLKKDMHAICKQHARDVKKICEKNGYYDSLRGHRPSEACMEAVKKKRAEGFHPLRALKENDPRKYKRLMLKWSEQRKATWHKERLRQAYGLERRTKLHIPDSNISHKASCQKYLMIKHCNYFADPLGDPRIICWDDETQRSAIREATAAKYGLRVVAAD